MKNPKAHSNRTKRATKRIRNKRSEKASVRTPLPERFRGRVKIRRSASKNRHGDPVFIYERIVDGMVLGRTILPDYGWIFASDSGWREVEETEEKFDDSGTKTGQYVRRYRFPLGHPNRRHLVSRRYYDRQGRLREEREYDDEGNVRRQCDYSYHRNGQYAEITCIEFFRPGSSPSAREVRQYFDESGRLEEEWIEEWDAKGKSQGQTQRKYTYDETGNQTGVEENFFPPN